MSEPIPLIPPVEKCSCCPNDATADVWTKPVCPVCFLAWMDEAPFPMEVEAKARPDQFDFNVVGTYLSIRQLKPGLLEKFYIGWTTKWIERRVAELKRGAA